MLGSQYPHRDIYKKGKTKLPIDVSIYATRNRKLMYNSIVLVGVLVLIFSVYLFASNYFPLVGAELTYFTKKTVANATKDRSKDIEAEKRQLLEAKAQANLEGAKLTEAVQDEAQELGLNSNFSVFIPKIDARANVTANVDAGDELSYKEALKSGIAHAAGTNFPGGGEGIFLFSHSTDFSYNVARFNAIFYLLRKLEARDEVVVYFGDRKHVYEVTEKHVVEPHDISWLTKDYGSETLILQTCDPPGTTWKRLIVVAKPSRI